MTEAPAAPAWPSRVEAVEIAKLDAEPGDTLIVAAKTAADFSPDVAEELRDFLAFWLPDVRIVVVGLPVELTVRRAANGGETDG